jgi:isoamylase
MILGGDELGRSQSGNNNAYCQDNEISWYNWESIDEDLREFTARLIQYRKDHPVFRRRRWFQGRRIHGSDVHDITWFTMEGSRMEEENWGQGFAKSIGVFMNGKTIPNPNPHGEPVTDDNFYLIFNAHHEPLYFILPPAEWGEQWHKELDTNSGWLAESELVSAGSTITVEARSLVVLRNEE